MLSSREKAFPAGCEDGAVGLWGREGRGGGGILSLEWWEDRNAPGVFELPTRPPEIGWENILQITMEVLCWYRMTLD